MAKHYNHRKNLPEQRAKRRGNGLMDDQLYRFAEAYYNAEGKDRTYTQAAIRAGVAKDSAHTLGSRWARLPQVQEYWKMLDKMTGSERRSAHVRALKRHEEFVQNPELTVQERISVNTRLLERTESAFEMGFGELIDPTPSGSGVTVSETSAESEKTIAVGHIVVSPQTEETLNIIRYSLEQLYGKDGSNDNNDSSKG